jgi:ribosome biogenesis GTPase
MNLASIGADARVSGAFEIHSARGLVLARVAISQRDQYRLYTETGEFDAEPSGALWYRTSDTAGMPVVGDWVAARVVGRDQAIIEAVLPRRTCFARRAAGNREVRQPIAANIDLLFLVCGLDGDFNLRRLERYLTLTAESGAEAIVVLNKSDLCTDLDQRTAETQAVARTVVAVSARSGDGFERLAGCLAEGRTVALLGSSGAGKSTIINRFLGDDRLRTGEVRESDSRGRHTTTHRELIPLPQGGALIDTPGMRELRLWASAETVESIFEEIAAFAAQCRYRDCSHEHEEGCAVAAALEEGEVGCRSVGELPEAAARSQVSRNRERCARRAPTKTEVETNPQGDAGALQGTLTQLLILQNPFELLTLIVVEDPLHALFTLAEHSPVILPHVAENAADLVRLGRCQIQVLLQLFEVERPARSRIESR